MARFLEMVAYHKPSINMPPLNSDLADKPINKANTIK